jgi:hypothetical protein
LLLTIFKKIPSYTVSLMEMPLCGPDPEFENDPVTSTMKNWLLSPSLALQDTVPLAPSVKYMSGSLHPSSTVAGGEVSKSPTLKVPLKHRMERIPIIDAMTVVVR